MGKKYKDEYKAVISVSMLTKMMVVIGLIGLVATNLFDEEYLKAHWIANYATKVIEVVASALFSAGLVSVIVEISTIKKLVSDAFTQILTGDFPLDNLNRFTLLRINKRIASLLTGISEKRIDNTVYRYERYLLDLASGRYYTYHNITYHITPDENNKCFHVKTKVNYKIINNKLEENAFEMRLKLYKTKDEMTYQDYENGINITSVTINGEVVAKTDILSIEPIEHKTESTYYDYKVRLYKELEGRTNKISAVFSYDVPLHDRCQSFRISVPCKELEHKFYIEDDVNTGEKWIIRANAYSTFFHRQSEENSNYNVEQNVDTSLIIRYKDWALVGNGYCVFYQKK